MSFLKEFKEDLSQAVNELVDEQTAEKKEETVEVKETVEVEETVADEIVETVAEEAVEEEMVNTIDEEFTVDVDELDTLFAEEKTKDAIVQPEPEVVQPVVDTVEEEIIPSDEVTEITKGTSLTGNIESDGSINVYGKITGDITCRGKLVITGRVNGTSQAKEIFANNAKVEGDVHSDGTIKIGNGSVIVGNVYATSAVIAGAVKGDIDVNGPVIVDGTAVVKGNIKSRSVQINNGAVIDGFCSQSYADIDYKTLFEDTFSLN